jgi:hypothetical protein
VDDADLEHPMSLLEKTEVVFHHGYPILGDHTEDTADSAVMASMSGEASYLSLP